MPKPGVKSLELVASKWTNRAVAASGDYRTGVETTTRDWAAAAVASQANYEQGVQEAISRKAYGKGVTTRGTSGWKVATTEKGPGRFAQGVQVGQGEYRSQVGPYLDVIAGTDLPPRGPRGSAGNYQRVQRLGEALRAAKTKRV